MQVAGDCPRPIGEAESEQMRAQVATDPRSICMHAQIKATLHGGREGESNDGQQRARRGQGSLAANDRDGQSRLSFVSGDLNKVVGSGAQWRPLSSVKHAHDKNARPAAGRFVPASPFIP
ncbi:unnamed protein product, partial [Iphiclides podalirius]